MLFALLEDFSRSGQFSIVTTCAPSLKGDIDRLDANVNAISIDTPEEELVSFSKLTKEADWTLIIAPETQGVLLSRRDLVDRSGGRFVGCGREAIEICGDKWKTFHQLENTEIPHLPTELFFSKSNLAELRFPLVCKPRDGAGCCNTFLIREENELCQIVKDRSIDVENTILQPFVQGVSFSVAALFCQSEPVELFPQVIHRMNYEPRISSLAMEIDPQFQVPAAVGRTVAKVGQAIFGLNGYVGFDLIRPDGKGTEPILVEINPRMTTSYLKYRERTSQNLALRLLDEAILPRGSGDHSRI